MVPVSAVHFPGLKWPRGGGALVGPVKQLRTKAPESATQKMA